MKRSTGPLRSCLALVVASVVWLAVLPAMSASAASASLVRDINRITFGSYPSELVNANGTLFYVADDGIHGRELWKTDGTATGTQMLGDVNPAGPGATGPFGLVAVVTGVFFTTNDGIHGYELWRSDGTAAGTQMVKDINPGAPNSVPRFLLAVGATVYFAADDGVHGNELWKSDGTAAGTFLVDDINPGAAGSNPSPRIAVGTTVYLLADDGVHGEELWKTDGTAAGTVLVKDVNPNPGYSYSYIAQLVAISGTLFFSATDGAAGQEPWKSDGTTAGTVMVKDIQPGAVGSSPDQLTVVGSTLYFSASDGIHGPELWKSRGTNASTVRVKDASGSISGPNLLTAVGSTLYFVHADDVHGGELWKTDGTGAGTVMVKEIVPGSTSTPIDHLTAVGSTLYFSADNGTKGSELWKSDGTAAGTVLVKDINPGPPGSAIGFNFGAPGLAAVGSTLYFAADDGRTGLELWRSDGTAAGTKLVKDINRASSDSRPRDATDVNGTLYFAADDGIHGTELWKTDGTGSGTKLVKDINRDKIGYGPASSNPDALTNFNGTLFFVADDAVNGRELWKSDGTAVGTVMVKDINPGFYGSGPGDATNTFWRPALVNFNGALYFQASDGTHGPSLWKSDGTTAGTVLVRDINPDPGNSYLGVLDVVNLAGGPELFFAADNGTKGVELWKSDGTTAGTVLVKDINPGVGDSRPGNGHIASAGGLALFSADDGVHGFELWKSDGTAAGTVLVKDIKPPSSDPNVDPSSNPGALSDYDVTPVAMTVVNNILYFAANDGTAGRELWKSNGTTAGTVLVKDINPGGGSSNPMAGGTHDTVATLNATLFFSADDGTNGVELWKSDGSSAGTVLVKDISPGADSSSPGLFKALNGTVLFAATTLDSGRELWQTNGSAAGTTQVADINPGAAGSDPGVGSLATMGSTLYFDANDGYHGVELWKAS